MSKHQKLIKSIEVFHKLALFGDRSSFLKSLALNPYAGNWETIDADSDESTKSVTENGVTTLPTTQIEGQAPKFKYDVSVEHAQEMLNTLGFEPELKVDGLLGDNTQKALDWYKGKSGVSGTNEVAIDMLTKLDQNTALAQRAKFRLDKNTFLNA